MVSYKKHCSRPAEKSQDSQPSATTAATFARPILKQICLNHQPTNELNNYSNCCWHNARAASSCFTSCCFLSFSALIPNSDDLVLGKVVASYVGQWNEPLQQRSDPCFLMSLVPHVFAEVSSLSRTTLLQHCCKDAQSP